MTTLLHIRSSSNLQGSVTRQIGADVLARLSAKHPGATVIERDLVKEPLPHISPAFVGAMFAGNPDAPELALSNRLIDELFASDIFVIEVPMYNLGIPSVLKAWVDHVSRAHKTFRYTPSGPEGLLKGKKVILVAGSGGIYSDGPMKAMDHAVGHMLAILGLFGISDIETIRIEGGAFGKDEMAAALSRARAKVEML